MHPKRPARQGPPASEGPSHYLCPSVCLRPWLGAFQSLCLPCLPLFLSPAPPPPSFEVFLDLSLLPLYLSLLLTHVPPPALCPLPAIPASQPPPALVPPPLRTGVFHPPQPPGHVAGRQPDLEARPSPALDPPPPSHLLSPRPSAPPYTAPFTLPLPPTLASSPSSPCPQRCLLPAPHSLLLSSPPLPAARSRPGGGEGRGPRSLCPAGPDGACWVTRRPGTRSGRGLADLSGGEGWPRGPRKAPVLCDLGQVLRRL